MSQSLRLIFNYVQPMWLECLSPMYIALWLKHYYEQMGFWQRFRFRRFFFSFITSEKNDFAIIFKMNTLSIWYNQQQMFCLFFFFFLSSLSRFIHRNRGELWTTQRYRQKRSRCQGMLWFTHWNRQVITCDISFAFIFKYFLFLSG